MRKTLLACCLALLAASPASAATAFVQSKAFNGFSGTDVAATFDANVTAGNLICGYVMWGWSGAQPTLDSVTDSLGNTYTLLHNPTNATPGALKFAAAMFYAKNISGGADTVTATFSGSVSPRRIVIHEVSGADTTAPLDVSAMLAQSDPGTGTDAVTSGSVTTTASGDYIFGATADVSQGTTPVAGTGFTSREGANVMRSEDQIQASAGSIAATFTGSNSIADYISGIMTFKPAGGGPPPRNRAILIGRAGPSRSGGALPPLSGCLSARCTAGRLSR